MTDSGRSFTIPLGQARGWSVWCVAGRWRYAAWLTTQSEMGFADGELVARDHAQRALAQLEAEKEVNA